MHKGDVEIEGLLIVHTFDSIEKKGNIKMFEQPVNGVYAINASGVIEWNIRKTSDKVTYPI